MRLPISDVQTVIVEGRLGSPGETGFVARSGNIPVGYFGDPEKTAETFQTVEGRLWSVSGDTARIDHDGFMTVFGRGSTCITTGGEKVFPEEVEEALRVGGELVDEVFEPGAQRDLVPGQPVIHRAPRVWVLAALILPCRGATGEGDRRRPHGPSSPRKRGPSNRCPWEVRPAEKDC